MFIERLSEISHRIDGALALSLVAGDGITVESVSSAPDLELDLLSAELITQVKAIAENHRDLAAGDVQQLDVVTDRMTVMVSSGQLLPRPRARRRWKPRPRALRAPPCPSPPRGRPRVSSVLRARAGARRPPGTGSRPSRPSRPLG